MEQNELIVTELKKQTEYGNRLLVDTFYSSSRESISNYYNIPLYEADQIVNYAFLKVITKIDNFEYMSESGFNSWVKTTVFNSARDYLRKKILIRKTNKILELKK